MKTIGVITGDIINSTSIKPDDRKILFDSISKIAVDMQKISPLKIEFFRGDSIQILVENPVEVLKIAVLLRAGIRGLTPKGGSIWDIRIAVGVGRMEYESDLVVLSDGEAFHFSGWEFDELGKKNLSVRTLWDSINSELLVSTAFADNIISNWSVAQAHAIYLSMLTQTSQKEVAICLNKTAQSVSKLLNTGKENLIRLYLNRFSKIISQHLS